MAPQDRPDLETTVAGWFEAFNARDLDGMIGGTAPAVRLYPLPLAGLQSSYHGHDGLRSWFQDLNDAGHDHKISLSHFRLRRPSEMLAIGEMRFSDDGSSFPFWARDLFDDAGLIAIAHHYLSDPELGASFLPR